MHKIRCPYDKKYSLLVEVTGPGQAMVYTRRRENLVFELLWYPDKYPTARRAYSTEKDSGGGFSIIPKAERFHGEKMLDTLKVIMELIRQGFLKYEES